MTTLTTLIYMKNSLAPTTLTTGTFQRTWKIVVIDYADYADIHDNMKNSFITEFTDYLVFNTRWKIIWSLTTLTTLILETI